MFRKSKNISKPFFSKKLITTLVIILCSYQLVLAQFYQGTINHNGSYSFDYTIECISPGTSAVVTLWYTTAEPPDVNPRIHLGGGVFVTMSGPSPYTYTITGLTSCDFSFFFYIEWQAGGLYQDFTPWTPSNTPLSADLFAFNAFLNRDNSANLIWATSSESGNDYFDVEYSINGLNWDFVGQIIAKGNSSSIVNYKYIDKSPNYSTEGLVFYRLKIVDLSGNFEYSPIRILNKNKSDEPQITFSPNPLINNFNIRFDNVDWVLGDISMKAYNAQGKLVCLKIFSRTQNYQIDLSNLNPSIYTLLFIQGNRIIFKSKVVKRN